MTQTIIQVNANKNPGCLVQVLWFAFVGWWACQLWIAAAWFLMILVITLPVGIAMINQLPKVVALREPKKDLVVENQAGGVVSASLQDKPQVNIFIRVIYFIFIGSWLSLLWMEIAYITCCTIIGMPVGFWMFDKAPAIMTLRKQ